MNRLKELRQEKKLTQQELANEIGVTKRTYIYWEKGERQIKPEKAQQLADYFGVSVGYLLGYIDDSEIYDDEVVVEPEKGMILAYSLERSNKKLQEKMFKDFIAFFRDNTIFVSDEEILSLYSMVQAINLNNSTPRGTHFTNLLFSNTDEAKQIIKSYSFVFGNEFARNDLDEQIHGYISEETRTKEKTEKLLKVLQSAYGERDYLD
ncbi:MULTISPECIES: helix-turn-helix domain-containing protein [Streptococcus]|uniref:XRE family transcriptional regulator n=1 Tax=Streptococcus pseudopneumoniae TaxID=257758 RepID=A0ABX9P8S9_9STRE|nr:MULTISPECIES: helix-turn-helix transcriptional regulator [Streptococcus]NIB89275.1 XRE family transcriptional regulator [Streptococcus pseudopneumoniae]RJQ62647.1 XRE family transcriptional regulator [Streptococcus pseudopneumoniae]RJY10461.1 XRE family transcriptional regulator [Streptococcus pseudopneumoniae]TMR77498.1 XRE family transcriptional regulator [Streptococcus pseudopneumoniae]